MYTSREAHAGAIRKMLGQGNMTGLSAERRLREAQEARRCRNLFFTAIAPIAFDMPFPSSVLVRATTRPLGFPIIITDMLNYNESIVTGSQWFNSASFELQVFVTGNGPRDDFFGNASVPMPSFLTLGHVQNALATLGFNQLDGPSTEIDFVPFLLQIGQSFEFVWNIIGPTGDPPATQLNCEVDIRAVTVLPDSHTYACLKGRALDKICQHIEASEPESSLVTVRIPQADFPAAGVTRTFFSEPQDRPLLVLGFASNIDGAQIRVRDLSTQWDFCLPPIPPELAFNGATGLFQPAVSPPYVGVPIYLIAPDTKLTERDAYNLLPVPHLLESNAIVEFWLTNGLRPEGDSNTYQQTIAVNGTQGTLFAGGDGFITMLCRTV